jgi:ribosome-associated toxin RatA of RatAB toxin-antitoxin module
MAVVEKSVLIEHTAEKMFKLVDDVEHYPLFLPWCESVEVHERSETLTSATLHLNFHGIKANFSTENDKVFPRLMTIRLREGMFRNLDGTWRFTPLGDAACKTEFKLHYEFANKAVEMAVGPVFNTIASTFIDSFVKRARGLHG